VTVPRSLHKTPVFLFFASHLGEPVILSAAGAKDLLFTSPQPEPSCVRAGKQVLRSRACRALAQDDNPRVALSKAKEKGEINVEVAVSATRDLPGPPR
jgi:hypothetical protein